MSEMGGGGRKKKQFAAKRIDSADQKKQQKKSGEEKKKDKDNVNVKGDKGCNCPAGCVLGEEIPAGAHQVPSGAVLVRCSNDSCPAVPWLHAECYDRWEDKLCSALRGQGRFRDSSRDFVLRNLWETKTSKLTFRACRCSRCDGYLRRAQDEGKMLSEDKAMAVPGAPEWKTVSKKQKTSAAAVQKEKLPDGKTLYPALNVIRKNVPGISAEKYARKAVLERDRVHNQKEDGREEEEHGFLPVGMAGWTRKHREEEASASPAPSSRPRTFSFSTSGHGVEESEFGAVGGRRESRTSNLSSHESFCAGEMDEAASNFLRSLERLVRASNGELWMEAPMVVELMESTSAGLMQDICDAEGLARWLSRTSSSLIVQRGRIYLEGLVDHPHLLQGMGTVEHILNDSGNMGILFCTSYQCRVFFDSDCSFAESSPFPLFAEDIVSFYAEEWDGGDEETRWKVVEFCQVLQRSQDLCWVDGDSATLASDSQAEPSNESLDCSPIPQHSKPNLPMAVVQPETRNKIAVPVVAETECEGDCVIPEEQSESRNFSADVGTGEEEETTAPVPESEASDESEKATGRLSAHVHTDLFAGFEQTHSRLGDALQELLDATKDFQLE